MNIFVLIVNSTPLKVIFRCYQYDISCYERVIPAIDCYTYYVQNLQLSTNKRGINSLDASSNLSPYHEELNGYIDA
jgi:hypothetical protein